MITQSLNVNFDLDYEEAEKNVRQAAEIIKNGGLAAFPTETVYGLGADAFNAEAIEKIYKAKGRPSDNPLITHIYKTEQLKDVVKNVPTAAKKLMDAFWPGPLTIIFEKKETVPMQTTGGRDTIAVRFPKNTVATELIRMAGVPIAAPSANKSGRPSPTEAGHVIQDFDGLIDIVLDGGNVSCGLESTIADVTGNDCEVEILRPGSITKEMILTVVTDVKCAYDLQIKDSEDAPRAPGMKYKHYAPLAEAYLVDAKSFKPEDIAKKICVLTDEAYIHNDAENGEIGIMATEQTKGMYDSNKYTVLTVGDRSKPETVASNLFRVLRRFDGLPVKRIYCEGFPEDGVGAAIMNRLKKACGGNIVN